MVRAQSIFGQSRFIIVSQHFHNERAIFLARRRGLDAVGFDAADVSRSMAPTTYWREYLARVQAVLDVTLLQTQPKFDGPPVMITQTQTKPIQIGAIEADSLQATLSYHPLISESPSHPILGGGGRPETRPH